MTNLPPKSWALTRCQVLLPMRRNGRLTWGRVPTILNLGDIAAILPGLEHTRPPPR